MIMITTKGVRMTWDFVDDEDVAFEIRLRKLILSKKYGGERPFYLCVDSIYAYTNFVARNSQMGMILLFSGSNLLIIRLP